MGDLGGLSLHKAITPQALWSSGSVPGTVPGPAEVAATLPSKLETARNQSNTADNSENKTHTGKDFNQPKVMARRAGVDLRE